MTAPPELWARVIVVQWAELLVRATEREWAIPDMKACGQALVYLLHCHFRPTINCYARTTDGSYRERPPERSKSKAAFGAIEYSNLFKVVLGVWSSLEAVPEPAPANLRLRITGRSDGWSFQLRCSIAVIFSNRKLVRAVRRNRSERGCHRPRRTSMRRTQPGRPGPR